MPKAVTLASRNHTSRHIRDLWRRAEAFDSRATMRSLGYVPHVTLGIFDLDDPAPLISFVEAATRWRRQTISFRSLKLFRGEPGVLWAEPCPGGELEEMHRSLMEALPGVRCHEHYRVGHWVPHCTLAMGIGSELRSQAQRWASDQRIEFHVVFDAVECVSFPPVRKVAGVRLDAADGERTPGGG